MDAKARKRIKAFDLKRAKIGKRLAGKWFFYDNNWDCVYLWFAAMDGIWPFVGAIYFNSYFPFRRPFIIVKFDSDRKKFKQIVARRFDTDSQAAQFARKKFKSCGFWKNRRGRWVIGEK